MSEATQKMHTNVSTYKSEIGACRVALGRHAFTTIALDLRVCLEL